MFSVYTVFTTSVKDVTTSSYGRRLRIASTVCQSVCALNVFGNNYAVCCKLSVLNWTDQRGNFVFIPVPLSTFCLSVSLFVCMRVSVSKISNTNCTWNTIKKTFDFDVILAVDHSAYQPIDQGWFLYRIGYRGSFVTWDSLSLLSHQPPFQFCSVIKQVITYSLLTWSNMLQRNVVRNF